MKNEDYKTDYMVAVFEVRLFGLHFIHTYHCTFPFQKEAIILFEIKKIHCAKCTNSIDKGYSTNPGGRLLHHARG